MQNNFKVGYKVATNWCWGEIEEILDDKFAIVSFCTRTGGGCLPFEFNDIKKITPKEYNRIRKL